MKRIALAISAFALAASAFFTLPTHAAAVATPDAALVSVLNEMRTLSDNEFRKLFRWANSDPLYPPVSPPSQPDQTEEDILALPKLDKRAVLAWLQGKGRSELYARGATDDQIGHMYRLLSPAPSAPPNAWRALPIARGAYSRELQGNTEILGSFVAVSGDGTGAVACVTFKNLARSPATRVMVDFLFFSADGQRLGDLMLDRRGQFPQNATIQGYGTLSELQSETDPRTDNCVQEQLTSPALPYLQARLAGFVVVRAEYADGHIFTVSSTSERTVTP